MIIAKLIPVFVVFGMLAAIVSSPIWGRWLRSYRDITKRALELSSTIVSCNQAPCLLGGTSTTLGAFVEKENIGAKISLVYCVNARMNDCFGEWATDTVKRLFPKVLVALIIFLCGFAIFGALGPQIKLFTGLKDYDVVSVFYVALGVVFSITEIYTAIGMAGRYNEITSTGKKLLETIG
jgi:hypothetical protein